MASTNRTPEVLLTSSSSPITGPVCPGGCSSSCNRRYRSKAGYLMGLVRRFQLSDLVIGQLQLDRGEGIVEVVGLSGADDGRGHLRFLCHPRQRNLGAGDSAAL